jgi:hypothetical protein
MQLARKQIFDDDIRKFGAANQYFLVRNRVFAHQVAVP